MRSLLTCLFILFLHIETNAQKMLQFEQDSLWGLMDENGTVIFEPQFSVGMISQSTAMGKTESKDFKLSDTIALWNSRRHHFKQ